MSDEARVRAGQIRVGRFDEIAPTTLYRILRLRVDVFVVEQQCPYPELDGRDLDADAVHAWSERSDGLVLGYIRVLTEPDGSARIGRVVVAAEARGARLASDLMCTALEVVGRRNAVLDAQAHLTRFYAGFGFTQTGPEFLEDGIPHVPMARPEVGLRPAR